MDPYEGVTTTKKAEPVVVGMGLGPYLTYVSQGVQTDVRLHRAKTQPPESLVFQHWHSELRLANKGTVSRLNQPVYVDAHAASIREGEGEEGGENS